MTKSELETERDSSRALAQTVPDFKSEAPDAIREFFGRHVDYVCGACLWKRAGHYANLPFDDFFQSLATVFRLTPGEGVYSPVGAPHWLKNGPQVSISLSVTFRSQESRRQATVYFINAKLRKLALHPVPPRQSAWRDSLKTRRFPHRTSRRKPRGGFLVSNEP